ncbi:TPA: potassium channel protein [Methanocaldococcus jannaschii]|uniref:Probable potassium channel protein 2 n=2 Tax=Methanocaldococcus jannaschii TaxID=2190 RepID=MJK2_METJA|nr:potassium channel protein [Methanocaldococcus jannaschii]Q58752.1 RecName: Full=Probable potassium channel protein 2; AltName: Full=MjK2 [Methanocaldococcus jannaschii DSM 2661]AAB99365.1 potassium channel protein, putative [Methanocaldococcus jannaschii DSM 2661]HII59830.1 potassium channel protein [Methanocaldococcus jannaschii]
METSKKLVIVAVLSITLILTYAYLISIIEGVDYFTALYFSVITITTTGYGDFTPKTFLGRTLTVVYLCVGVGIVMYLFSLIAEFIVEGKFEEFVRLKKMKNKIKTLKDHYIICGYGRLGKVVGEKFIEENIPFIAIDINEDVLKEEYEKYPDKFLYIVGDAKKEEVLKKAKIDKAKGLIATLPSDADNVFLTLTARELNPNILITAKADEKEAIRKLKIAGANRVVSPYLIGGLRMAEVSVRPGILDFLSTFIKIAKDEYEEDIELRKFVIEKDSELAYKSLKDANIRGKTGATILGIRREKEFCINPYPEFILKPGDVIYAFGTEENLKYLENLVKKKKKKL